MSVQYASKTIIQIMLTELEFDLTLNYIDENFSSEKMLKLS